MISWNRKVIFTSIQIIIYESKLCSKQPKLLFCQICYKQMKVNFFFWQQMKVNLQLQSIQISILQPKALCQPMIFLNQPDLRCNGTISSKAQSQTEVNNMVECSCLSFFNVNFQTLGTFPFQNLNYVEPHTTMPNPILQLPATKSLLKYSYDGGKKTPHRISKRFYYAYHT